MPEIFLLLLCWCHTHYPNYLMPSSFSAIPIIQHIFCCPHHPVSLTHIFCCCLNHPSFPPPSPLLYLSGVIIFLCVWFCHHHQPAYIHPLVVPHRPASLLYIHPPPPYPSSRNLWRPPFPSFPQLCIFWFTKAGRNNLPPQLPHPPQHYTGQ